MAMTDEQIERYSRHIILKRSRRKRSEEVPERKVLIIGAVVLVHRQLCIWQQHSEGTIGIVDADEVDLSNLQRQIIHTTADIGKAKVKSAKRQ